MNQPTPGMQVTPSVRLLRCMGSGAMGSVWLAEHTGLETQVVVKFIAPEVASSPEVVARFAREAAAASRVKSPHVVQMLDHGVVDGSPYIIMELLEGRDLQQRIREQRRLPPAEVAVIIGQLSKALSRAHDRGVLHRDIKPSNIFLCDVGNNEIFVKLLDFGVAKTLHGPDLDTTKTGAILGTPFFMSPEQLVAGEVDHRSDLWALGVLSFMLLTGKRPFRGDSIGTLTLAVHVTDLPVPSAIEPSIPKGFDEWFKKACARDPGDRFQSARELSEALFSALEIRDSINVGATGSVPAMVAEGRGPADAPSVPGLGSSAYNYATAAEVPQRSRKRVAIAIGAALLTVVLGLIVIRTRTTPAVPPPPAPAQQPIAKPVEAVKAIDAKPTPSASASTAPAPAPAKPSKAKPKTPGPTKNDDPFGDSRH